MVDLDFRLLSTSYLSWINAKRRWLDIWFLRSESIAFENSRRQSRGQTTHLNEIWRTNSLYIC